uniref:Uncharacterized protein n=1 Tax=Cannabis sativa TaxID=3483 RepID=A0A803PPN2_CANSA
MCNNIDQRCSVITLGLQVTLWQTARLHGIFQNKNASKPAKPLAANFSRALEDSVKLEDGQNVEQDLTTTLAQCQKLMTMLSQRDQETPNHVQCSQPLVSKFSSKILS